MKIAGILLASLMIVSCASAGAGMLFGIDVNVVDDPASERIRIEYTNESGGAVCLLPEFWPNDFGRMNHTPGSVYVTIGGEEFPLKSYNSGYCPGGCALRVGEGERATAFFTYDDFGIPPGLYSEQKDLTYRPRGSRC